MLSKRGHCKSDELPVEREIRHEKARTLGRAGEALDAARRQAWALFEARRNGEPSVSAADYQVVLARALELRRLLLIQREAIGLRSHGDVDRCYPLPPQEPIPPGS